MSYYACFVTVSGHLFRFDTRIYLGDYNPIEKGNCVGAIVGKNPGSAKPTELGVWGPLDLSGDKMLPSVRNRFLAAFKQKGKEIPQNSFVQVWNLFYLCNPSLNDACKAARSMKDTPICQSEENKPNAIWFAWGGSDPFLDAYKRRFFKVDQGGFYYDHNSGLIVPRAPIATDFAKHPQGMPAGPVVTYLSNLV